jgi:hypothetical protein
VGLQSYERGGDGPRGRLRDGEIDPRILKAGMVARRRRIGPLLSPKRIDAERLHLGDVKRSSGKGSGGVEFSGHRGPG